MILDAAKRGVLTRLQADPLPLHGPEAVVLFALAMAEHVAKLQPGSPSTPSGMIPVHQKPSVGESGQRRKKQ